MIPPGGSGDSSLLPGSPPILQEPHGPAGSSRGAGWRHGSALLLLGLYVAVPGVLGVIRAREDGALLPGSTRGLLGLCAAELLVFAVVFLGVVRLGDLRWDDLYGRWRSGWWLVPRAAGWSLALRILVGMVLGGVLVAWQWTGAAPAEVVERLRPKVEAMVNVEALRDPVYLALMLTLVSFVLAGAREELWRAGMVALLGRVSPGWFGGRWGPWLAMVPTAVLFGTAHAAQGAFGAMATAVLGLGLGAVMLIHRSLWDAVLAHGFFNATTFLLLVALADRLPELTA